MSQEVIEVLNWFAEKLGMSVDWTQENITPMLSELCGKYARYEIVTSVAWIAFAAIIILLAIFYNGYLNTYGEYLDEALCIVLLLSRVALLAIGVTIIMCQIYDIAKCVNFPELAFAEYLKTLIGTAS